MGRLAPAADHRNNFDLLRLLLATAVVFSHSWPLATGSETREPLAVATHGQATFGGLAVNGFFVISGYLVTRSWFNSGSAGDFLLKRALRIYPGFWVAFAFSLVVGVIGAAPDRVLYLKRVLYLRNELFVASLLWPNAGVLDTNVAFATNPGPYVVNGSSWTLRPELFCYLLVAGLGLTGFASRRRWVAGLFAGCCLMVAVNGRIEGAGDTGLWRFATHFLAGAVAAVYADRLFPATVWRAAAAAGLLVLAARTPPAFAVASPTVGGWLLLAAGTAGPVGRLRPPTGIDLSYGIYLYSYPVQQLAVWLAGVREPLVLFAAVMPVVAGLAWLSWTFVESPALRLKAYLGPHVK